MPPSALQSRRAISLGALLAGLVLLTAGVQLAARPLGHTDLWGHLACGRYFAQHGEFPDTEPFLEHQPKRPYLPNCWLSQWGGYQIDRAGGTVALQLAYAVTICGIAGVFLAICRRVSGSWMLAVIGCAWFLWLEYQQLRVVRPQQVGMLCYLILLGLLYHRRRLSGTLIAGIFLVMVLWTNLHGSFAIAPVILLIAAAGRILDTVWNGHRRGDPVRKILRGALRERAVVRNTLLAAGLTAISLLNPFGWKLWVEVVTFSNSPNLRDLIEWKPLWQTPKQGTVVLISLAFTVLTLASVRLRPRWEHWLPVLVLGSMMVHTARYIVWWTPLLVLAVLPYWNVWSLRGSRTALFQRVSRGLDFGIAGGRLILTAGTAIALWFTPWGNACFRGGDWSPPGSYNPRTPIAAAQALRDLDPSGPIFNTMEWGDWIIWSTDNAIPVFVYTHVPEIPQDVWQDYVSFVRQTPGWKDRWDARHFSHALIEYRRQDELAKSLEDDPAWEEVYRDGRAVIFQHL